MENLKIAIKQLIEYKAPSIDQLPEIDLYMDQVLSYVNRYRFLPSEEKDMLTASMINNYVKDDVIQSPVAKKYNKEGIISVLMLAQLKKILPINDIKKLFNHTDVEIKELYQIYQQALDQTIQTLKNAQETFEADQNKSKELLVLHLSIDASIKAYLAQVILNDFQGVEKVSKKKIDKAK